MKSMKSIDYKINCQLNNVINLLKEKQLKEKQHKSKESTINQSINLVYKLKNILSSTDYFALLPVELIYKIYVYACVHKSSDIIFNKHILMSICNRDTYTEIMEKIIVKFLL